MTAKRFECGKGSRIIIDNETKLHYIMTLDWECSLVTKLLNHFSDENEQLKQINHNLGDFRNFITEQNVSNEKQRKELQLQMLRLYNYFENWFEDTMSPNAFSEMWDNVKEDKEWEKR